jgi:hypothetical protein
MKKKTGPAKKRLGKSAMKKTKGGGSYTLSCLPDSTATNSTCLCSGGTS